MKPDEDLRKFWNKKIASHSEHLWLPRLSDQHKTKQMSGSWFSIQTSQPLDCVPTEEFGFTEKFEKQCKPSSTQGLKSYKIKLSLKSSHKKILNSWNNHYRYTYNSVVGYIKDAEKPTYNKIELRNKFVSKKNLDDKKWLLETPKHVRESAVFEVAKNYKSCFSNLQNGNIDHFDMGFLSKKKPSWSFEVPKSAIKTHGKKFCLYQRITNGLKFKAHEFLPLEIEHDCKIHFDGLDYYLCIPMIQKDRDCWKLKKKMVRHKGLKKKIFSLVSSVKTQKERVAMVNLLARTSVQNIKKGKIKKLPPKKEVIALDPGTRTFMTGYEPNKVIEIGNDAASRIRLYKGAHDRVRSQRDKAESDSDKRKLTLKMRGIMRKVRNLRNEMHHQVSRFLVDRYKVIILPPFGVKKMTDKEGRVIPKEAVKSLTSLKHYQFSCLLKTKACETDSYVLAISEAWTTKTCGSCGKINESIKYEKEFNCPNCRLKIDRDFNGARNILLRSIRYTLGRHYMPL